MSRLNWDRVRKENQIRRSRVDHALSDFDRPAPKPGKQRQGSSVPAETSAMPKAPPRVRDYVGARTTDAEERRPSHEARMSPTIADAGSTRIRGRVKWFREAKGYGFIVAESGADVFVHYSAIRANGFKTLPQGAV